MYGALGVRKTPEAATDIYPFLLDKNGNIDFGSWEDLDSTPSKSNIYDKNIRKGEMVTITDEENCVHTYQILHWQVMGQSKTISDRRLGIL